MDQPNNKGWLLLALAIPLAGLLVLVGRAELNVRSGPTWRIDIRGYDPRSLLHGHYLRYQFDFNWVGGNTCGQGDAPSPGCCLCLSQVDGASVSPQVRQVECAAVGSCTDWLKSDAVVPPLRYFVPEARARQLERALAETQASLELVCTPSGQPAIRELYLNDRPWREALE